MFAVIFEVEPRPERWDDYLAIAGGLRPELERIEGFVLNERFRSERNPGRLLSLSLWEDEQAVIRWRSNGKHHAAQARGRSEIFRTYRLRVGEVTETATKERAAAVTEWPPDGQPMLPDPPAEIFRSIQPPDKRIVLTSFPDVAAALRWTLPAGALSHRVVRIVRDYGLNDRQEAPQHFPDEA